MSTRNIHTFALVLSGVSEPDEQLEDALFQSGCDDAMLAFRSGVAYVEFDREGTRLDAAVLSAIRDVERADSRLRVVGVEPGDRVNAAEIARRAGITREYVRLLWLGERGMGEFPAPRSGATGKALVWSWAEVARWLGDHGLLDELTAVPTAETLRDINLALEMRSDPATVARRMEYLRKLPKSRARVGARS